MKIPFTNKEIDIFSYGFNKNLNRDSDVISTPSVYDMIREAVASSQVSSGGISTTSVLKTKDGSIELLQSDSRYSYYNVKKENLTNGAANIIFKIACNANDVNGGVIEWTLHYSNGNHVQCRTGYTTWAAVNRIGTFTTDVDEIGGSVAESQGASTLTGTWTAVASSANEIQLRFTPTSSLTEGTTLTLYARINSINYKNITLL